VHPVRWHPRDGRVLIPVPLNQYGYLGINVFVAMSALPGAIVFGQ
jgi:hypothetical protein